MDRSRRAATVQDRQVHLGFAERTDWMAHRRADNQSHTRPAAVGFGFRKCRRYDLEAENAPWRNARRARQYDAGGTGSAASNATCTRPIAASLNVSGERFSARIALNSQAD